MMYSMTYCLQNATKPFFLVLYIREMWKGDTQETKYSFKQLKTKTHTYHHRDFQSNRVTIYIYLSQMRISKQGNIRNNVQFLTHFSKIWDKYIKFMLI